MDFAEAPRVTALRERLLVFMDEVVYPNERTYAEQHAAAANRWETPPVMEEMKTRAQEVGLWNLFLPESRHGGGLTNLEYASLCEIMGRSAIAPESSSCS